MKQQGILNSDISRVLSYMGHTDTICIGDCGLPIPDETERIDLAVKFGQPSFMDVLEEVGADMKVEKIILAEEMKLQNPEILRQIEQFFAKNETGFKPEIQFVLHSDLIIAVLNNGLNILGVSSYYQDVVKGIVILIAVLSDRRR